MKRVISAIIVLVMIVVLPTTAFATNAEESIATESKKNYHESFDTIVLYQAEESDGSTSAAVLKGNALIYDSRTKFKESDKDATVFSLSANNADSTSYIVSTFMNSTLVSIKNSEDLPTAIGNITTDTAKAAVKVLVLRPAATGLKTLIKCTPFAALSSNPALWFLFNFTANYAIDWAFEQVDPQEIITDGATKLGDTAVNIYEVVADDIEQLDIPGKADTLYHDVADALAEGKTVVITYVQDATNYVDEKAGSLKTSVVTFFSSTF